MSQRTPVIALVGPPNVGKSTLFNTIIGKRVAITGPKPGTTRDRAYAESTWNGKKFMLIDTGGLAKKSGDPLEENIRQQTQLAMNEADAIVFVVDGKQPVSSAQSTTKELKDVLRKNKALSKLPIFLAVNKVESQKVVDKIAKEFPRLGLGQVNAISALTGRGVGDLLDTITATLEAVPEEPAPDIFATVALVGRPNAGKSTLINHLAGEERAIVSPLPGTTRAAVDTDIEYKGKILRFIDTAGMRRRSKIDLDVEEYALFQALKSFESADVVVLLLDGSDVRARFEQTIAGKLKSSVKGIVLALNKIDLVKNKAELEESIELTRGLYPFLRFAELVPISAEKGTNIDKLLDAIVDAKNSREISISEEDLRKDLKQWMKNKPPVKLMSQKKPVIYAMEQVKTNPPVFVMIVNDPANIHYSYVRYIENQMRKKYGFEGTALKIRLRKPQTSA